MPARRKNPRHHPRADHAPRPSPILENDAGVCPERSTRQIKRNDLPYLAPMADTRWANLRTWSSVCAPPASNQERNADQSVRRPADEQVRAPPFGAPSNPVLDMPRFRTNDGVGAAAVAPTITGVVLPVPTWPSETRLHSLHHLAHNVRRPKGNQSSGRCHSPDHRSLGRDAKA